MSALTSAEVNSSVPLLDIESGLWKEVKSKNEIDSPGPENGSTFVNIGTMKKGLSISWENITARTKNNRVILNGVSGEFPAFSLSAIMGRSGSGKTTLLNILTGNNHDLEAKGNVLVNGVSVRCNIAEISGYVRQEDLFLGELTVMEHLRFRSKILNIPKNDRDEKIRRILHQFQLEERANTKIGTPGVKKTLSGGERKRLSLATEILADPLILFCDEPTTGLDSTMAESYPNTRRPTNRRNDSYMYNSPAFVKNFLGFFASDAYESRGNHIFGQARRSNKLFRST